VETSENIICKPSETTLYFDGLLTPLNPGSYRLKLRNIYNTYQTGITNKFTFEILKPGENTI